jgi:hypothetical protein
MKRFLAVLLCALALPVSAQQFVAINDTVLFDANGKSLGSLMSITGVSATTLRMKLADGSSVFLPLTDKLQGTVRTLDWVPTVSAQFESRDCTGTPHWIMPSTFVGTTPGGLDFNNVFYLIGAGPFIRVMRSSRGANDGVCYDQGPGGVAGQFYEVTPYGDLDDAFVPPFRFGGPPSPAVASFTDVPSTDPYYEFIELMRLAGLTGGCGGGNFCPDQTVTRRQMAVFLSQVLGLPGII